MNPLKISADLEARIGIGRAMQLLVAVLALASLLLALHVFLHQDRDRVTFLPPQIERGFWVEADRVSRDYLDQMALFVLQLAYNVTPSSVDFQNAALLKYAAPEAHGALEKAGRLAAERVKRDQVTTLFSPRSVLHDQVDALRVAVTGELTTYVTDKASPPRAITVLVAFRYDGGRTVVTTLKETTQDDPFGDQAAAAGH
ncbi:MAG: type IV conjugative transfer system protein TraE [Thiobacillus sp.]|nr:type IV conjugative transfer system protein TraE [Thiobacillus sp.]